MRKRLKNKFLFYLALVLCLLPNFNQAQVSFSLSPSLCQGGTCTVTALTGSISPLTYNWSSTPSGAVFSSFSTATTAINFPTAGNFTINLGVVYNTGFQLAVNSISIFAITNLTLSPTATVLCPGETCTITAVGALSYLWTTTSFSGSIAQPSISGGSGIYCVKAYYGGSCMDSSRCIGIGAAPCTGMKELVSSGSHFKIYPNPASDKFYISSENTTLANVEIADAYGKVIFDADKRFLKEEEIEIDLSNFPTGIYFVKIKGKDGTNQSGRLIKK